MPTNNHTEGPQAGTWVLIRQRGRLQRVLVIGPSDTIPNAVRVELPWNGAQADVFNHLCRPAAQDTPTHDMDGSRS